MSEYEFEPVRGLPGRLPAGEHIRWQGSPDWRALARTAFHVRKVAAYFAILVVWSLANGALAGVVTTIVVGVAGVGVLAGIAWLSARTTVYTITNRRVVMRFGIALPKCINLPMVQIASADLRLQADGLGDIPLALAGRHRLGWLALWPHARAWRIRSPEPMLRALPDAADVADLLARTLVEAVPSGTRSAVEAPTQATAFPAGPAVAA